MRALASAASLHQPVLALRISPAEEEAARFREYWTTWGNHVPLQVVESPYRAIIAPHHRVYRVPACPASRPHLTVIVPELALRHRWQGRLHDSRHHAPSGT
jgi:hypothetical protein